MSGRGTEPKNPNLNNTSEDVVLKALYRAGYKGKLVVKKSGFGGRSYGFKNLYISPDLKEGTCEGRDQVRHEYGHSVQFDMLGPLMYFLYIAIPSITSKVKGKGYYDQPWEITADIYGGVERGGQSPDRNNYDAAAVEKGRAYLKKLGVTCPPVC